MIGDARDALLDASRPALRSKSRLFEAFLTGVRSLVTKSFLQGFGPANKLYYGGERTLERRRITLNE
jgi:hypothetical protein